MKFAPKLTAAFMGISVIIIAVMLTIAYFQFAKILEGEIRTRMESRAIFTMDALDRFLSRSLNDIKIISEDAVIGSENATAEEITERLIFFRNTYKWYASFSFFNLERIRIADTAGLKIGEQSRMTRYWEDVLAGQISAASDVHISEDFKAPVVYFASQVKNKEGKVIGVVVIRILQNRLFEMVKGSMGSQEEEEEEEIDIANKDGLLIYSNHNREGILKDDLPIWESVKMTHQGKVFGSGKHRNPGEKETALYVFCQEQGYLDFKGNGWVIISHIPVRVIFAPVNKLLKILIILFLVMLSGTVLVTYLFSKTVSEPLVRLSFAAAEIGKGKLDTVIEVKSKDEIGSLANTFNQMVANLKKTTTSIDSLNKEITRRKQAEETIRVSEEQYRSLVENIPDVVWTTDVNGKSIFIGQNVEKVYGYTPEDIYKGGDEIWFSRIHPDDKERVGTAFAALFEKGSLFDVEYRIQRKDGEWIWLHDRSIKTYEKNGVKYSDGLFADITERKRIEGALKDSEGRFRAIFDHANDGILLADEETKKFYTGNNTACQMLGYSLEEIKNLGVADIHPKEDLPYVLGQFERQVRKEIAVAKDLPVKRKDGSVFYADVNTSSVALAGRTYLLGLFRDVTERKRSEGVLIEAMKVKSDFTSTVSHELRTPLTAIREGIALVLDGTTGVINAEQKEFLSLAKRNVDRLARLINDVLDFQKLQAQKMLFDNQENDINELIKEVHSTMAPLADKKGLGFALKLQEGLPRVKFDRDRIVQVLTNLMNNAIKFTEKGSIVIASSRGDNNIQVTVKDTGPGVKVEDMGSLFKQFSQLEKINERKTGGTGLGLAISKEIIERHKGRIWAESEFGKGTTFCFIIPVKTKDKVLVIDDDKGMLDIIKNFLEKKGHDVTCSEKGLDGIEIIGRDKPDLVILDMKLKDISGFEIIGRLRSKKETLKVPIIVMSGHPEELLKIEDRQEELALVSIAKPFDLENLLSIARKLLQQSF